MAQGSHIIHCCSRRKAKMKTTTTVTKTKKHKPGRNYFGLGNSLDVYAGVNLEIARKFIVRNGRG